MTNQKHAAELNALIRQVADDELRLLLLLKIEEISTEVAKVVCGLVMERTDLKKQVESLGGDVPGPPIAPDPIPTRIRHGYYCDTCTQAGRTVEIEAKDYGGLCPVCGRMFYLTHFN